MRIYLRCCCSIFLVLSALAVRAQERSHQWWSPPLLSTLPEIDSIAATGNDSVIAFDFEHALSLYRWGTSIYATSSGMLTRPKISIGAEGRSRLRQDTRVRTSEAGLALGAEYPLLPRTAAMLSVSATSYALDQKATSTLANIGKLSSINDGYASLGVRHALSEHLSAEAFGGMTVKAVDERESVGPIARGKVTLSPLDLEEGLTLSGTAFLDERRFNTTQEVLRNDGAQVALTSNFAEGGLNAVVAGVGMKRRDFFFPRDTSGELIKQERSEFMLSIRNDFFYPIISDRLNASITLDIAPRTITRRTPDTDLNVLSPQFLTGTTFLAPSTSSITTSTLRGGLDYLFTGGLFSAELRYEERAEANTLLLEDAQGLSTALSKKISDALNATSFETHSTVGTLRLATQLSANDRIHAEFNARIYRFDTPSEQNVDDRDEQYLYSFLRYEHRFTPQLEFVADLKAAQGHLVYIKSDRSAQNNRTQKIALANAVRFTSENVRNTISGEVFANYTEYDFMLPTSLSTNDFIIRGLSAADSFFVVLARPTAHGLPWGLAFRGEYRISERGTYNAASFSERPLLASSELLLESLLQSTFGSSSAPLLVRLGVRGFFLARSSARENTTSLNLGEDERSSRIGPLVNVIVDHTGMRGARLYGSLWYSVISTTNVATSTTTFGTQVEARLVAEWRF